MLRSLRSLAIAGALALVGALWTADVSAQVTTGSMRGSVVDSAGNPIQSARVTATHTPSGTIYQSTTRADGGFIIPGLRVGGPYTVEATRIGFARQSRSGLNVGLGVSTDVTFRLGALATQLSAVTVTSTGSEISQTRTGAVTSVPLQALEQLPTISRRIDDFTRLTPQASGSSFAGVDNRLNNIMVDGAYFNNSFGLGGQPGDRTGVAPISLDAIEAVQVSIAPYDVRQGNFVGAAVNTVTKSGTNDFSGSVYYLQRDNDMVGKKIGGRAFNPGTFDFSQVGARIGGPLIKNKLFFFASFESDGITEPGTTFRALQPGETQGGQVTRVRASSLDSLSNFLSQNFGYATGPYQGYDHETPSLRLTAKLDYAMNDKNKFSLRYTKLDSKTDVLLSNSNSLGFGNRRSSLLALNFQNSNYQVLENIESVVGEWNAVIGSNMSNNMIIGYTKNDESRDVRGGLTGGKPFPLVDILDQSATYTSFGFEPFTPNNELRYNSQQFQNNFTIYGDRNDFTLGVSVERYESENIFFPGSQSVYVYNSLSDFYRDANDYLANPNRTVSPVTLPIFQVRYANQPGMEKPVQPLEVLFAGVYAQNEFRPTRNLTTTFGLRVEQARFGDTGFENPLANAMVFRDENGVAQQYETQALPKPSLLFSPRFGFNWDVAGEGTTQVRGGTGVFTGRPAYVWISNQIGNNGVLTGFEDFRGVTTRPFHPDPDKYKPAAVTGAPAATYELALTDKNFKFPQILRTNLAVDRKLPFGTTGTVELLLAQDINGIYYVNANLSPADGKFNGPDQRPRWFVDDCPASGVQQRINCSVTSAVVLKNQDVGRSWNLSASLEKAFTNGFFAKAAYSYGLSRNTVDPGSIAFGSWNGNAQVNGPNNPGLGFSGASQGHRYFLTAAYTKKLLPIGPTGISFFLNSFQGNGSYVYGGDFNGDGGTSNDLLYVPKDASEMRFLPITGSAPFSVAQQIEAFEKFIQQDRYLRNNRGEYVKRGGIFTPMTARMDVSLTQDIVQNVMGKPNKLQVRMDLLNFTNMFNSDWGRSWSFTSSTPLVPAGVDASGVPQFRMRTIGSSLLNRSFQRNFGIGDVWRMQLGVRYTFN